jgi:hypothetical protein
MSTFLMACMTCCLGAFEKILDVRARDKTVPAMGHEVQIANWLAVSIAALMVFMMYIIYAGVNKKKERGSAEEVESLRAKSSYDHDYNN